ncbi:hypothetical protein AGMMS49928_25690 [Spirochaetia bacterium]|nr:hypothetical protein AGMMS49928_25690 [Spirochaetia bacterium]
MVTGCPISPNEDPNEDPVVAVTGITNGPSAATAGTPLVLSGTVQPSNATNKTIVWTVKDAGETGAAISGSTLNTTAAGSATVTATIVNGIAAGTDYAKDFIIAVTVDADILNLSVYSTSTEISNFIQTMVTGRENNGTTAEKAITVKVANANFASAAAMTPLLQGINDYYVNLEIMSGSGATFPNLSSVTSGVTKDKILSLILPETVTAVAAYIANYNGAFYGFTGLTSVSFPGAVTIGSEAFQNCGSLVSVNLPKATTIGDNAFQNCGSLVSVNLPKATTIGGGAFFRCTSLATVGLPVATSIGNSAFSNCDNLDSVSLPAAASIGNSAFSSCPSLTSVDLPKATSIGYYAFTYCTSLASVSLPVAASIDSYTFRGCTNLATVDLPKVTSINGYAFEGCTTLVSVDLPVATIISAGAFYGCTSLASVDLPAAISIGNFAFYGCTSLVSVDLPVATSIGSEAFSGCDSLVSVSLPVATSIGNYFFYLCTNLSTLTLPATPPTKDGYIFSGIGTSSAYQAITIRVPTGSSDNYSTSTWPRGTSQSYGGYVTVTFVEY